MFGLGGQELLVIFLIVLVLFGAKKIPELMRGVGQGVGELQKGLDEGKRQVQASLHKDDEPTTIQPAAKQAQNPPSA